MTATNTFRRRQDPETPTMREVFTANHPVFMRVAYVTIWVVALSAAWHTQLLIRQAPAEVFGQDSHAYWAAARDDLEYSRPAGTQDAYLYSPAFLTLIAPLTWLPWPAFQSLWVALLAAVSIWLVKPLGWKWGVPLFLCSTPEIYVSNIYLLLAASAVIGMRHPAAWAFPVLTKVTTGVGLVWFLARGQWRQLGIAAGATALIVTVSYIADPSGWQAWVEFLLTNRDGTEDGPTTFAARAVLGAALVAVAARVNWPWVIVLAMLISTPVLVSVIPLAILLAIPRLVSVPAQVRDEENCEPAT